MWITVKIEWNSRFEIENNDLGSKKEQNERQRIGIDPKKWRSEEILARSLVAKCWFIGDKRNEVLLQGLGMSREGVVYRGRGRGG